MFFNTLFFEHRFHAKLLQDLHGESVLQRTFSRAVQARVCAEVVIATESDEVHACKDAECAWRMCHMRRRMYVSHDEDACVT
jgi:CMP-2-keto-3-deoxyoctulosonic acid synthetase